MEINLNEEILKEIKLLIPKAPDFWITKIAAEMGKSENSIYAYIRGDRGFKKGYHKDVLRILKRLVEEETEETLNLLSNVKSSK